MNEQTLNQQLLNRFPELKGDFDEYTSWQDGMDTGAFLTYEDLLLPLIRKAIESEDSATLGKVGILLEEMLDGDDEYAQNVATVGILEALKSEDIGIVNSFLKDKTRKVFDSLLM